LAKKKSTNQPVVAEEPARPEEQFRLDESATAPPSPERKRAANPYSTRSARERRATRSARQGSSRREREHEELSQDVIAELLEHPTKTVTEAELREAYAYVIHDLRSMAILAAALVVALIALAQVLPK
jgi:hypothetical protein